MAIKAVDATQLDADLASIADAIRAKTGLSDELPFPEEFVSAIAAITSGDGSGNGIQTASVTAMNTSTENNITFTGINALPDWFVVFADPESTRQISTAGWHYIIVTKIGETISATAAWAEKPSGGMGTGGLFNVEKRTTGITASINLTPVGLKIIGDVYFLRNTKYTIVYGSGTGSGGGTGGITPSGNKAITASTSVQSNIDVTQYATVSVSPTPTESKTVTLGANAPSAVTPSSGKYLSQVNLSLDTSVFKAANIASGVTMLGVTGTYTGGGGSSGGSGNIGSEVTMTFANSTPSNAKGYAHYRRATVDTTKLIGFYAHSTSKVQRYPDDDAFYHMASVFYITEVGDGVIGYCSTASNDDTQYRTKALSDLSGHVEVSVGAGYVAISTPTSQSGVSYLFCDDYNWTLYPIYSA